MQSRLMAGIESIANTASGFFISLGLTFTILPFFGYDVTVPDAWGITAIFTAASVLRSYAVRRIFNRWSHHG